MKILGIPEYKWWQHTCEYGHFDCSYEYKGPCGDEHWPTQCLVCEILGEACTHMEG